MKALTSRQKLFGSISLIAVMFSAPMSWAQVTISEEVTTEQETNGQDLTIDTTGIVTVTTEGPAVTLNSDNALSNAGAINIADIDNATGVSLEGGANRSFTNSGAINIVEEFVNEDVDEDGIVDGEFASGTGRTGILISGASPFEGNVELEASSSVAVEGNDSFGINLDNTAMAQIGLSGNLSNAGFINVGGDNATGVNIGSGLNGNFENTGTISALGEGAQAINVAADIQGGFVNAGNITNTGFRFTTRPGLSTEFTAGRDLLDEEDLLQAGSAVNIGSNITGGVLFENRIEDVLDADGNQTFDADENVIQALTASSNVQQFGSAPAVLIDGNGSPISIGLVAAITDPNDESFDGDLQYAFINQSAIAANGVFDDVDSNTIEIANATLEGGLNNTGTLSATSFVAPTPIASTLSSGTGRARVILFGDSVIADQINNSGVILASSTEAVDALFQDRDNIPTPRDVVATAIEIESSAVVNSLENSGGISALLTGRTGEAIGIIDRSGTLNRINNSGAIVASAGNSDPLGTEETNFSLIAIDVSANTEGFTFSQVAGADSVSPAVLGDIRLGSGDDAINLESGSIIGNIDFADGNNNFSLSGASSFLGTIQNQGGLNVSVAEGSTLTLGSSDSLSVTSANFDGTSTFAPTLDGSAIDADPILVASVNGGGTPLSGLQAGDITFEDGSSIAPNLTNIAGLDNVTFALARAENSLSVGDINTLSSINAPFLYDTNFQIDPNDPNTLLITLDLRDPNASIADGGLGLDAVQSAAFASTFTALSSNTELGNAFSNITDGTAFNQAFNQLLPEFAAAARQFVFSNVDGATGAVSNHLDTTRRSQEKPGGAWIQEFAYFADRELAGLSEQYRGSGFGFTGGIDTAFGPFHALGINVGFASTEIEDVVGIDEPLDVVTLQAGLYGGLEFGGLSIDAYAGGGYNDFEQNREVRINTFSGTSQADWSGTHINGSLRAGYDFDLNDKFWIRPAVSVDYLRLSEDGYTEDGDAGIAISVDDRTSETAGATALINLGAKFQGERTWIRPSIRAGFRHDFINDPIETNFRFVGLTGTDGQTFNSADSLLQSALFPDNGIILGFSIAAGSAFSSIGFDFDSDIRDGFIRHTGRVVVRLLF